MLVKVSHRKKRDWFGYEYSQRISITEGLFHKVLDLLYAAQHDEEKENILDPMKMLKDKVVVITHEMLEVVKEELEAHSTRRISLDKDTALFVRGQY